MKKSKTTAKSTPSPRRSLANTLLATHGLLALLTVICIIIAFRAFTLIERNHSELAEYTVPIGNTAHSLTNAVNSLSSRTSTLSIISTQEGLEEFRQTTKKLQNDILQRLTELKAHSLDFVDMEPATSIAEQVNDNLNRGYQIVEQRLQNKQRENEQLAQILRKIQVIQLDIRSIQIEIQADNKNGSAEDLANLIRIQSYFTRLKSTLNELPFVSVRERFSVLKSNYIQDVRKIAKASIKISDKPMKSGIASKVQYLLEKLHDDQSIFKLVANRLASNATLLDFETRNNALTRKLEQQTSQFLAAVEAQSLTKYEEAQTIRSLVQYSLLVLGTLAILAAILLITLYISPKVSRRLTSLSNNVSDLTKDKLELTIDRQGNDELAQMANALEQFRNQRKQQLETENELNQVNIQLESHKQALDQFAIVAETNANGKITYANDQFCKITRYKIDEVLNKDHRELVNSGYHDKAFWQHFWETIQSGQIWRGDICNYTKDKTIYWVDTTIVPITDYGSTPTRYLAIRFLITERKEAEEQLKQTADQLAETNQELKNFAYVASHDLQEPLRTITSYIQILEKRHKAQFDAESLEFMEYIVGGAHRMKAVINDLLAYSQASQTPLQLVEVGLNTVVDETIKGLHSTLQESQAILQFESLSIVLGNPIQLSQLFQNLIGNALKFRKKDHPLVICILTKRINSKMIQVTVKDNGIGIAKKHFERIFSIFQRLHTQAAFKGTGIGLAICKKIVERHGGDIWVESTEGEGTQFHFTLQAKYPE